MREPRPPQPEPNLTKPKIGAQLIVFGRTALDDLRIVMEQVKEAGYAGIETGNLYRRYSPGEVKDMMSATGLAIAGVHSGYDDMDNPDWVADTIQFMQDINSKYLMVSGVRHHDRGIPSYDDAAKLFNQVGRQCKQEGITFCYHNHAWEFDPFQSRVPMHYLIQETDPDFVKLCIDIYWVQMGGEDPAEFVKRYQDRAAYFHFKDGSKGVFTELGRGQVDFDSVMPVVSNVAPEWIVYEQDRTEIGAVESCRISREFLRTRLNL